MKKNLILLTLFLLLSSSLVILCNARPTPVQQTSTATVWIRIYRIQAVDPIEGFLEGEADWHYYIWVWNGETWSSVDATSPSDQNDVIEDKIYSFSVQTVSTGIRIALLEDDTWTASDVADISGYSGGGYDNYDGTLPRGARYEGTYDLRTNLLTGDEVISEGGYLKTSGDYDNSVGVDENDANLWFSITDNYGSPQADAGFDQTVYTHEKVNFDGSKSKASSGSTLVKYQWDFENDGIVDAEGEKTSFTYTEKGQYHVVLKVTDNLGETDTDTLIVNVLNRAPTASFTYTPSNPTIQDTLNFVDTSDDQDGTIASWDWDFGDGTTSTLHSPTHQYTDKGDFTVRLRVTDNDGASDTKTLSVTIYNLEPTADFSCVPSPAKAGEDIQFADESTDPEGHLSSWLWEFGDDYTSTVRNPIHNYEESGPYTVKLTVKDDEEATHVISRTITIEAKSIPEQPVFGMPLWILLVIIVAVAATAAVLGITYARKRKPS